MTDVFRIGGGRWYGNPFSADALANIQVGGTGASPVAIRFRAARTQEVTSLQWLGATGDGYSGGTGGSYTVEIRTDDGTSNHFPTATVLYTGTVSNPVGDAPFITVAMSPDVGGRLRRGQLYHIVITNADGTPAANYISIDSLYLTAEPTPKVEVIADEEYMLLWNPGAWATRPHLPVFSVTYADGYVQGQGYTDRPSGVATVVATGTSIRQSFTVTGRDRTVTQFAIRCENDVSGDLSWDLTLVGTGTVDSGTMSTASTSQIYLRGLFSSPVTLASGSSYTFTISAVSSAQYTFYALQADPSFDDTDDWTFTDGKAEVNTGAWADLGGQTYYDWQLYFQ